VFEKRTKTWGSLDYVAGWFINAADYGRATNAASAFVSTNSICQGQQVQFLWPLIFETGRAIAFAYTSFKWANLASDNAGVTVVVVGLSDNVGVRRRLFEVNESGEIIKREVSNINPYLVPAADVIVWKAMRPMTEVALMDFGNKADDGGHLTFSNVEVQALQLTDQQRTRFIRRFYGSSEFINGVDRYCLWISDSELDEAMNVPAIVCLIEKVRNARLRSPDRYANKLAARAHQFKTPLCPNASVIVTPRVSSENRPFLPVGLMDEKSIIGDRNFAVYDAPLWNMALIASRLHWVWISTVCVRLEMRFSYSNTLGWNTFPIPPLTEKNKTDLTRCGEDILLAREAHFPATIADLYDPETMPEDLKRAHEKNDETLERIYIGRRFRNDTERLEKLFDLYTKMTQGKDAKTRTPKKGRAKS
jgi:hypothetical protein